MGFRNMYIAASAGSGKTYQLVNRFVALLCLQKLERGQADAGRLIAITFTRKAAGEFKDRILAALAEAAMEERAAARFWRERIVPTIVDAATGICPGAALPEPPALAPFFASLLREVTNAFARLKLGTIDSLFQQMATTLSTELGLSGFTPLDPAQESNCRRQALDLTYRLHREAGPETEAAVAASFRGEAAMHSPDRSIMELVNDFHESVLASPDAHWGGEPDAMSEEQLALFGLRPEDIRLHLSREEYGRLAGELAKRLPEGCSRVLRDYARSLADTDGKLEKRPSATRQPYKRQWEEFCAAAADLGTDPDAMEAARAPFYWRRLLERTRALHRLILDFEQRYQQGIRSRGLLTFADVPRLLRSRMGDNDFLRMEERTDARLEHWLLDEFQDTSQEQYGILCDLLTNRAADEDGSVFMVGDAKQSIYQFRGGDPRLFRLARRQLFGLGSGDPAASAEMPLDTSYRSTQEVLDLANALFGDIASTARNASAGALALWQEFGYQPHRAAPHMQGQRGCVRVEMLVKESGETPDAPPPGACSARDLPLMRRLAEILAEARPAGSGCVPGCAILIPTRQHGLAVQHALEQLQAEYGFEGPVSFCDDTEVGQDSPMGTALTQLFHWLISPGDSHSLSLLALCPLGEALLAQEGDPARLWEDLQARLAAEGVSGLLRQLAELCPQVCCSPFMAQRWALWVQAADSFDSQGGSLSDWLAQIEAMRQREEPQGNDIRIMTYHKSKGLEFDMVLLPFLSNSKSFADYSRVSFLASRGREAVLLAPTREACEAMPGVEAALYTPWREEQEFAGFCSLYVAVTRARHATYVLIPPCDDKKRRETLQGKRDSESRIQMMLQLAGQHPMEDDAASALTTCLYRLGDPQWHASWRAARPGAPGKPAPQAAAERLDFRLLDHLESSTPSGLAAAAARQHGQRRLQRYGQKNQGTGFGTLVHRCFEQVGWLAPGEEPSFAPAADSAEAEAQASVRRALGCPAIRALFTRPATPCRLYREQGIEALSGGNTWLSGQIDRLVVGYDAAGQPARAHILDFKSDACEAAELKPEYAPQMREYRRMTALAFGLPEAAVGVTLIHAPRQGEPAALPYAPGEL